MDWFSGIRFISCISSSISCPLTREVVVVAENRVWHSMWFPYPLSFEAQHLAENVFFLEQIACFIHCWAKHPLYPPHLISSSWWFSKGQRYCKWLGHDHYKLENQDSNQGDLVPEFLFLITSFRLLQEWYFYNYNHIMNVLNLLEKWILRA